MEKITIDQEIYLRQNYKLDDFLLKKLGIDQDYIFNLLCGKQNFKPIVFKLNQWSNGMDVSFDYLIKFLNVLSSNSAIYNYLELHYNAQTIMLDLLDNMHSFIRSDLKDMVVYENGKPKINLKYFSSDVNQ